MDIEFRMEFTLVYHIITNIAVTYDHNNCVHMFPKCNQYKAMGSQENWSDKLKAFNSNIHSMLFVMMSIQYGPQQKILRVAFFKVQWVAQPYFYLINVSFWKRLVWLHDFFAADIDRFAAGEEKWVMMNVVLQNIIPQNIMPQIFRVLQVHIVRVTKQQSKSPKLYTCMCHNQKTVNT